jgi:RNA polymerase sigma factor (sigma-70 family)
MNATESLAVLPVHANRESQLDATFVAARPQIVAICRSIVGDEAEDIVQDAYLIARSRLGQLRDVGRASAWITKIAINLCFGHRRRRDRLARLLPFLRNDHPQPDPDLGTAIDGLPTVERAVIALFYGHGLSVNEIAQLLDRKPATVRSLMFRARSRLRTTLIRD